MNTQEIKEYIAKTLNYDPNDDEGLMEELLDAKAVYEGPRDDHRWISYFLTVVQIGEKYFQYNYAHCDGDDSIWDQGYEFLWDEVTEVFPEEVTTIVYVEKK